MSNIFAKLKTKEFWKKAYDSLIWLMIIIFLVDIISKWIVQNNFVPKETYKGVDVVQVIPTFLYFTRSHNMGAAWGMGSGGELYWRIIWIAISVIMSGLLTFIYIKNFKKLNRLYRVGIALMIAGAVGNMIDRIFYWENIVGFDGVIDWIQVFFGSYAFPTFNIADASLVIGAIVLAIALIIELIKEAKAKSKRGEYKYSPKELEKLYLEKENENNEEIEDEVIENSDKKEDE